jgi:hypothetical protein
MWSSKKIKKKRGWVTEHFRNQFIKTHCIIQIYTTEKINAVQCHQIRQTGNEDEDGRDKPSHVRGPFEKFVDWRHYLLPSNRRQRVEDHATTTSPPPPQLEITVTASLCITATQETLNIQAVYFPLNI